LSAAGIEVGVSISPIIPGLNVSSIPNSLKAAREAGALFTFIQLIRLPGSVEQVFLHRLQEKLPHRYSKVTKALQRMRGGEMNKSNFGERMRGEGVEWEMAVRLFQLWKKKLGFKDVEALDQPSPFRRPGEATQLSLF